MRKRGRGQLLEEKHKQARKDEARLNELYVAKRSLPLIPLDVPIKIGYTRFYAIRDDLLKSPHKDVLKQLLPLLNNKVFCKSKKFVEKDWKTKKIRPIEQELKVLDERSFNALSDKHKSYFYFEKRRRKTYWGLRLTSCYVFKYPWMFKQVIVPEFITHRQVSDGDLASEIERLNNKLYVKREAYKARLWARGSWYYDDYCDPKTKLIDKYYDKLVKTLDTDLD